MKYEGQNHPHEVTGADTPGPQSVRVELGTTAKLCQCKRLTTYNEDRLALLLKDLTQEEIHVLAQASHDHNVPLWYAASALKDSIVSSPFAPLCGSTRTDWIQERLESMLQSFSFVSGKIHDLARHAFSPAVSGQNTWGALLDEALEEACSRRSLYLFHHRVSVEQDVEVLWPPVQRAIAAHLQVRVGIDDSAYANWSNEFERRMYEEAVENRVLRVGTVAVDGGVLMIADPMHACECANQWNATIDRAFEERDDAVIGQLHREETFLDGSAGSGVVFKSGHGDGLYDFSAQVLKTVKGVEILADVQVYLLNDEDFDFDPEVETVSMGMVAADSGYLMITDPAYYAKECVEAWQKERTGFVGEGTRTGSLYEQMCFDNGSEGLGIVLRVPEGVYEVEGQIVTKGGTRNVYGATLRFLAIGSDCDEL